MSQQSNYTIIYNIIYKFNPNISTSTQNAISRKLLHLHLYIYTKCNISKTTELSLIQFSSHKVYSWKYSINQLGFGLGIRFGLDIGFGLGNPNNVK